MPKAIACIPHKNRIESHRIDYLKSISDVMDYPFQSEDSREPAKVVTQLTEKCRSFTGLKYWHFTDCCTDALQLAFHRFCQRGDTVIVPAYGWRAIKNAPELMGMNLVYCDIDDTGNINPNEMIRLIHLHKPTAILVVHNFGTIVDCEQFTDVCAKYNVAIIEDAAPSFVMNEPYDYTLGSFSDAVCFSFDFTKSPGTLGSGGAIATNDELTDHYLTNICSHNSIERYVGTKTYLDNTSAAVLLKDIELIEEHNYRQRKVEVATWYINNLPYKTLSGKNYIFHRFIILPLKDEKQNLIQKLKSQKILAKPVYAANTTTCEVTNEFVLRAIELPCHQFIDVKDLKSRFEKIL